MNLSGMGRSPFAKARGGFRERASKRKFNKKSMDNNESSMGDAQSSSMDKAKEFGANLVDSAKHKYYKLVVHAKSLTGSRLSMKTKEKILAALMEKDGFKNLPLKDQKKASEDAFEAVAKKRMRGAAVGKIVGGTGLVGAGAYGAMSDSDGDE